MSARRVPVWPVWVLAVPAAVSVWAGWVGLGQLTGFGVVQLLPGIWDGLRLNTAVTLPIGMEAYAAYALYIWLHPGSPVRARRFAKISAFSALGLGGFGQVAFHLMAAAGWSAAPWPVTALVACFPLGTLGMGATLAHLISHGQEEAEAPKGTPIVPSNPQPVVEGKPAPIGPLAPPLWTRAAPAAPLVPLVPGRAARFDPAGSPGIHAGSPGPERSDVEIIAEIEKLVEENGGELPSQYQVRQKLGIGQPRAARLLAGLNGRAGGRS